MVEVILQVYPVIPADSYEERKALRPLGRHRERYQQTLQDWNGLIREVDKMGVWGVATIEHHFHSEGYEVGPNPGMLDAYWAAITENVRVGQLGYVMSAQHPIRVAEEIAILDHMTQGRMFVGFARGYQHRWTNVFGQHLGSRATISPSALDDDQFAAFGLSDDARAASMDDDAINREVFEEQVDLVMRCLREDLIEHNSPRWQIPYPYDEGTPWTMTATRDVGAPGEMDEDNRIRGVSVVPAPYSESLPVFVSSNASVDTIRYCAKKGYIPTYFASIGKTVGHASAYLETSTEAGFSFAPGQNQNIVRWPQMHETTQAARDAVAKYDVDIFRDLYVGTVPKIPFKHENPVDSVLDSGLWAAGSIEQVKENFIAEWEQVPAEYVTLIYHFAQMPKKETLRQIDLFMEHVKPELDKITNYNKAKVGGQS